MTAEVGSVVIYANGLYEVAEINGDTLVLDGVVVRRRMGAYIARPRCSVLMTDVTVAGMEGK